MSSAHKMAQSLTKTEERSTFRRIEYETLKLTMTLELAELKMVQDTHNKAITHIKEDVKEVLGTLSVAHDGLKQAIVGLQETTTALNGTNGELVGKISLLDDNIQQQDIVITNLMEQNDQLKATLSVMMAENLLLTNNDLPLIQELLLSVLDKQANVSSTWTSLDYLSLEPVVPVYVDSE
jgi:hypothetical protein